MVKNVRVWNKMLKKSQLNDYILNLFTLNTFKGIFQSLFPIKLNNRQKLMRKSIEKLESVNPVSFVVDALIRN
jgi:hypothetical protein